MGSWSFPPLARRLAAAAACLALAAAGPACGAAPQAEGVWRNPKDSVHIEIRPCGKGACGTVVWANDKAKADARRGGTETLVGLTLFEGVARGESQGWAGSVFVPDLNRTFKGTAVLVDSRTLRVRGCAFAGLVCKAQDWKRLDEAGAPPS